jgi:drug/metabolite transporter (DMT)-like permease
MKVRLTRTDLLLFCVMPIWAAGFSVVKFALREIGPLAFAAVRFLTSALLLLIWVLIAEGKPVIRREDWLRVGLLGLAQVGVYQIFFTVGLKYTTASNSSLLLGTIPIWTAIIATAWRQERITPFQILGILLSVAGSALVIAAGNGNLALTWENFRGDIFTVMAAILAAAAAVMSKPLLRRYSALRLMSISMICGSLFLLPFGVPEMVAQDWAQVSLGAWLALVYNIVLAGVLTWVIYFRSIGEIGATGTAVYNTLIPPMAVLVAILTLGERFTPWQALGAAVVLGGVMLTRLAPASLS